MKYIWSYIIVAFCMVVTSARVMDFPGNRNGFQDNLKSGVKDEKVWTPPTTRGLIIDSKGYPGNSNDATLENFSPEDLPPFFSEILTTLFKQNEQSNDFEILFHSAKKTSLVWNNEQSAKEELRNCLVNVRKTNFY